MVQKLFVFQMALIKLEKEKDFEQKSLEKRESIKNYFKNYDVNVDENIFKSLLPIYLKHLDDDLESTMVNSFIDKYQFINDYVEYLYEKVLGHL